MKDAAFPRIDPTSISMYGVPKDLDLSAFIGQTVLQVAIGPHDLQINIHPDLNISLTGRWEMRDATGNIVDQSPDGSIASFCTSVTIPTWLPRIVSRTFVRLEISPPVWFELEFDTGDRLRVFDDSPYYESCTIWPAGVII